MNKSVLVVDNSLFMRTLLKKILKSNNYQVLEALKQSMSLDLSAKIIMCSSLGQQHLLLDDLPLGAKDFIVKPYFDRLN
jgi:two-component system chemotaxis response regulator CheY